MQTGRALVQAVYKLAELAAKGGEMLKQLALAAVHLLKPSGELRQLVDRLFLAVGRFRQPGFELRKPGDDPVQAAVDRR